MIVADQDGSVSENDRRSSRHVSGHRYHRVFTQGLDGKYAAVAQKLCKPSRILEIGCHTGSFSRELRALGHTVVGIERDPTAAAVARTCGVEVLCGDVMDQPVTDCLIGQFDVILLMDVLEHLTDPDILLTRLRHLINPSGSILITGPNVAYWRVRLSLFCGNWIYVEAGILDKTHLRFYTAAGWKALIQGCDYEITGFASAEAMLPLEGRLLRLRVPNFVIDRFRRCAVRLLPNLFTTVFLISARLA